MSETSNVQIDNEIASLCPPLTVEERQMLEKSILSEGCRDPLSKWRGILLDGHNRLDICNQHDIPYEEREVPGIDSREAAKLWVLKNQLGRRNLSAYQRAELALRMKPLLVAQAKERRLGSLKQFDDTVVQNSGQRGKTDKELASLAGVSHDTIHKADYIDQHADDSVKEQLRRGETTINRAYTGLRREERKQENDELRTKQVAIPDDKYDVVVIDPPWPMEKIERDCRPNQAAFDYPTMAEEELAALEIPCRDDCHVWVWTTQKFLPMAFRLLDQWGMRYVCTFVWHKPGGIQPYGLPQYNAEFALYGRKGSPKFVDLKAFNVCFDAPRGLHSEKPAAFYDMVSRVTDGRRIDMFSRRQIEGFDAWGNEVVNETVAG